MWLSTSAHRTHYEAIGQGFPLVMLHGWGCDWQIWSPIVARLSEKFRLILPDLPAFGKSELKDEFWTSDEYVAWLGTFINETVGNKSYGLLGHSFGGKISALYVAKQQPKNLNHLFLIDSAGIPTPLNTSQQITKSISSLIPTSVKESLPLNLRTKLLIKLGSSTDHLLSSPQQRTILKQTIREDINPALSLIKVPTTIIWGLKDQETSIDHAHRFHHSIKNSQLEIFPNADHFPFIQDPNHFCEIIEKTL